jgi:hypothetical protein
MDSIVAWERSMGIRRWKGENGMEYICSPDWEYTNMLMDRAMREQAARQIDQERLASLAARAAKEGGRA